MPVSVSCPRGHRGAHIVRAGTYGIASHRRQLFRCVPHRGAPHRFAERVPRARLDHDATCPECLSRLTRHQGQPYPRRYHFAARLIATALIEVAAKHSYRNAGEVARTSAGRVVRKQRHGQALTTARQVPSNLVGDWVETYAPVLWAQHGPGSWPETLQVDEDIVNGLSKKQRRRKGKPWPLSAGVPAKPKKGGQRLYSILCAEGYPSRGEHRPWAFWACPSGTVEEWVAFFRSLPGIPRVIVGDAAHAWQKAVPLAWPAPHTPEIVISEYHLARILTGHLKRLQVPPGDPLWPMALTAFDGPSEWATALAALGTVQDPQLARWLRSWGARIATQLARHAQRPVARSTGTVENTIKALNNRIERRRAGFTNRERLNRLLMLYAMEMATTARFARLDQRTWAATIRDWLDTQWGGRPPRQRAIRDRNGPSLRYVPPPPGQGKRSQTP